ncbi:GNAT superfamily N-acetyltransferase [Streptacidiphilus sp. MAP12-16]|uniref:GNAT family N-acetyltransferase n=1 Tax=Streptacidiphilus sp. MAP12-16 TaxID=3156300 RepID=UPI0035156D75
MGETEITVRPATGADLDAIAGTLARAFHDDPQWRWSLPVMTTRTRRLRRIFATILRYEVLPHGAVEIAVEGRGRSGGGHVVGAAVWLPPGKAHPPLRRQIVAVPGFLRGYGRRIRYGQLLQDACFRSHPRTQPHWYLYLLGVEPDLQGTGVGAALLRSRLDRVDAERLPAYLESSNPVNIPLYEHFGFKVTGALGLPKDAPTMDTMWRAAKA